MKSLLKKLTYEIELVSQLSLVFVSAVTYGWVEARFIPTSTMPLPPMPLLGHFSTYHFGLLILMAVASFALAVSHLQWMIGHRKLYPLLMGVAAMPLSLLIEDATWFIVLQRPIRVDEWTMIWPGAGINFFGLTYIPGWYFVVAAWACGFYWWSNKLARDGYRRFVARGGF